MNPGSIRLRLLIAAAIAVFVALAIAGTGLIFLFERHVERRVARELTGYLNQLIAATSVHRRHARGRRRPLRSALRHPPLRPLLGSRHARQRHHHPLALAVGIDAEARHGSTGRRRAPHHRGHRARGSPPVRGRPADPRRLRQDLPRRRRRGPSQRRDCHDRVRRRAGAFARHPCRRPDPGHVAAGHRRPQAAGAAAPRRQQRRHRQRGAAGGDACRPRCSRLPRRSTGCSTPRPRRLPAPAPAPPISPTASRRPLQVLSGDIRKLREKGEVAARRRDRHGRGVHPPPRRPRAGARARRPGSRGPDGARRRRRGGRPRRSRWSSARRRASAWTFAIDAPPGLAAAIDEATSPRSSATSSRMRRATPPPASASPRGTATAARGSAVTDDGPGIPDQAHAAALARGVRLDTAGGTGLGLAIVTDVVDAYGGRLEYRRRRARPQRDGHPAAPPQRLTPAVFPVNPSHRALVLPND